jgi:hypothetical protein
VPRDLTEPSRFRETDRTIIIPTGDYNSAYFRRSKSRQECHSVVTT